jgi:hypothetical protein
MTFGVFFNNGKGACGDYAPTLGVDPVLAALGLIDPSEDAEDVLDRRGLGQNGRGPRTGTADSLAGRRQGGNCAKRTQFSENQQRPQRSLHLGESGVNKYNWESKPAFAPICGRGLSCERLGFASSWRGLHC